MIKSRPPITFYIWTAIAITFSMILLFNAMSVIGVLIYGIIGTSTIYFLINTRDCRIMISEDKLIIRYLRPFFNREIIDLKGANNISFYKGQKLWSLFFNTQTDSYIKGKDKLVVEYINEKPTHLLINTNRNDVKLIVEQFNNQNKTS